MPFIRCLMWLGNCLRNKAPRLLFRPTSRMPALCPLVMLPKDEPAAIEFFTLSFSISNRQMSPAPVLTSYWLWPLNRPIETMLHTKEIIKIVSLFCFFFFWFFIVVFILELHLWHMEVPRLGSWIRASHLGHSHSKAKFLAHWVRPGIEPTSSWILVGFLTCWVTTGPPSLSGSHSWHENFPGQESNTRHSIDH